MENIKEEKIIVVGHKNPDTDAVVSAIAYAELKKSLDYKNIKPVVQGELNNETKFVLEKFNIPTPELKTEVEDEKVILVDHFEKAQAINNANEENIIEIVDHHKIGDIKTSKPIFSLTMPLGSTATIIYLLYKYYNIKMSDSIKGILLSAIISDTVILKSPITTEKDKEIVEEIAKELNLDYKEFGKEQFEKKADFSNKTKEEILQSDMKVYEFGDKKIAIVQVEVPDTNMILKEKEEYLEKMRELMDKNSYYAYIFLVTDIIREGSELLIVSDNLEEFEKIYNISLKDGSAFIEGFMSRKKQAVPPLEEYFSK